MPKSIENANDFTNDLSACMRIVRRVKLNTSLPATQRDEIAATAMKLVTLLQNAVLHVDAGKDASNA